MTAEQLRALTRYDIGHRNLEDDISIVTIVPQRDGHFVLLSEVEAAWNTRADSGEAVAFDGPKDDRAMLLYLMQAFDTESWQCPQCGKDEECATMDSAYLLREYLAAKPRATAVDLRALAFSAIESEPELSDEMPDEMWLHLRDDRDAVTEALRIAVRQTKQGIRERLQAAIGKPQP